MKRRWNEGDGNLGAAPCAAPYNRHMPRLWWPSCGRSAGLVGQVPRLHPDGPDCMGPRVPTWVISPFVNPGSVSHSIFDDTSILKTILVKYGNSFRRSEFELYGKRVAMINHMGAVLDRDVPRMDAPVPTTVMARETSEAGSTTQPVAERPRRRRPTELSATGDEVDFGTSLALAMTPKRGGEPPVRGAKPFATTSISGTSDGKTHCASVTPAT